MIEGCGCCTSFLCGMKMMYMSVIRSGGILIIIADEKEGLMCCGKIIYTVFFFADTGGVFVDFSKYMY